MHLIAVFLIFRLKAKVNNFLANSKYCSIYGLKDSPKFKAISFNDSKDIIFNCKAKVFTDIFLLLTP